MKTSASRAKLRGWAYSALVALGGALFVVLVARGAMADDTLAVESRLAALDGDVAHKTITQEARDRARAAVERSKRFRAAGDETHAKLSDRAAITWVAAGEDLTHTADAEARADDVRRSAMDAGAQVERERALLEETMLQNGRLRAELDQLGTNGKPHLTEPVSANTDGGASGGNSGNKVRAKDGGTR